MDAHAMENWGLITGRASHYLLDSNTSNLQQKQAIVSMQFHEIAHMWSVVGGFFLFFSLPVFSVLNFLFLGLAISRQCNGWTLYILARRAVDSIH
jgi:hypothetical protein